MNLPVNPYLLTQFFNRDVIFACIFAAPNNEERKNSDIETIFTPRRSSRLSIKSKELNHYMYRVFA